MIISKFSKVKKNARNHKHYIDLGYTPENGFFIVKVSDLTKSSRSIVTAICDYCGLEKDLEFKEYSRNISFNDKFSCSNYCASLKKKELSIIKYGVNSPSKLEDIKIKSKETNLKKYGTEYYFLTDDFKKKSKETKISKFGTENPMSLEAIKDKIKITNLEKYGVENPFQSEEIKFRIRENNLEKYGVARFQSTIEFKNKFKKTFLDKYGVDNPMMLKSISDQVMKTHIEKYGMHYTKTKEFIDKTIKTNQSKYGVDFPMKSPIFLEKLKNTNKMNLGVDFPMMSESVRNKSKETLLSKYGSDNIKKSEELRRNLFNNCKDSRYIKYLGNKFSEYICEKGHTFQINSSNYIKRNGQDIEICTICNPIGIGSDIESKFQKFIQDAYKGEVILNYRDRYEIDVYLPNEKLGFEFNGIYWHSNLYKEKSYHINKSNFFDDKGIRIVHIWEDDWRFKSEIIKSQISNILGLSNRIYARKCDIIEVSPKFQKDFLNKNHIQGSVYCDINIGLVYKDEIVSIMSFNKLEGRKRMGDGEWCLARYCSSIGNSVIGGPSKCLNYFIKKFTPNRIISYADRSWSCGKLYKNLGFNSIGNSNPDYKYILNGIRIHKSNFTKSKLSNRIGGDISDISESKLLSSIGVYKIYDCGKIKFELIL